MGNMNKKILVASWHNGGVGPILPVGKELKKRNFNVNFLTYDSPGYSGSHAFKTRGVEPNEIIKNASPEHVEKILKIIKPEVILTGTSAPTPDSKYSFEQSLIQVSNKLNIHCVSVLDFWSNYMSRFSLVNNQNQEIIKKLHFIPNVICVMDELAKNEMIKLNFPESLIHVTGNPEFNYTYEQAKKINVHSNKIYLEELNLDKNKKTFLVLTNNHEEYYGNKYGYNEKTYLKSLLSVLNGIVRCPPGGGEKHFQETKEIIKEKTYENLSIVLDSNKNENVWLSTPDIIIGMYSTVLLKARFYNKPSISFQPNLCNKDFLITNSLGITTLCTNNESLEQNVKLAVQNQLLQREVPLINDSIERIIKLMRIDK